MNKFLFVLIISNCLLVSTKASFFPESFERDEKRSKSLLEVKTFPTFIKEFETKMSPLVKSKGGLLQIILEQSAKINAEAIRDSKDNQEIWIIKVYEGLLTYPFFTKNEVLLVLCHELGHHLGGSPTAARDGWAACEGQADYWSTKSCFLKVTNGANLKKTSLNLTRLYARIQMQPEPSLSIKDDYYSPRTNYGYPSAQCRLDTLLAGASNTPRPRCWFSSHK